LSMGQTTPVRIVIAALALLLVVEAIRRTLGWALVILVVVFVFVARFSYLLPGPLYAGGTQWPLLLIFLYTDPGALFNMVIIAMTIGVGFIFFGQVVLNFGGGKFLTDIAVATLGRFRGGPAKAAVVGSGLVGSITGGALVNVMLTGPITIPMMKNIGYSPEEAAAIEAVASTGGQVLPPVMGIAVFVMAEFLGVPYADLALRAFIPAIVIYLGLLLQVDFIAMKRKMRGVTTSKLVTRGELLKKAGVFVPIVVVLIYTLFGLRFNPATVGVYSGLFALFICIALKENRTQYWRKLLQTIEDSGRTILNISIMLAGAGFLIGSLLISGLAFNFSLGLLHLAGGNLFALLLLTAIASFILGCALPTVACYVLVATLVAPALVQIGVPAIAAHMFVFYWGVVANITPPVALAAYGAATLARCDPIRAGFLATRMGILFYIVPFLFVFWPAMLLL
jgi:TRAP transporter 4TM/12TM fusion protein